MDGYFISIFGSDEMKKHLIIVSIILLILISIMAVASAEDKDDDKTVQPKVEKVGESSLK